MLALEMPEQVTLALVTVAYWEPVLVALVEMLAVLVEPEVLVETVACLEPVVAQVVVVVLAALVAQVAVPLLAAAGC